MHQSRKLKRFARVADASRAAHRVAAKAERRFCIRAGRVHCCVNSNGYMITRCDDDQIDYLPEDAYALYLLLERAFGKE